MKNVVKAVKCVNEEEGGKWLGDHRSQGVWANSVTCEWRATWWEWVAVWLGKYSGQQEMRKEGAWWPQCTKQEHTRRWGRSRQGWAPIETCRPGARSGIGWEMGAGSWGGSCCGPGWWWCWLRSVRAVGTDRCGEICSFYMCVDDVCTMHQYWGDSSGLNRRKARAQSWRG